MIKQTKDIINEYLPIASKFPKVKVIPNFIGLKKTSMDCTMKKRCPWLAIEKKISTIENKHSSASWCLFITEMGSNSWLLAAVIFFAISIECGHPYDHMPVGEVIDRVQVQVVIFLSCDWKTLEKLRKISWTLAKKVFLVELQ